MKNEYILMKLNSNQGRILLDAALKLLVKNIIGYEVRRPVPLGCIAYDSHHRPHRFQFHNSEPVRLSEFTFNGFSIFTVDSGNHRCGFAENNGWSTIDAIVNQVIINSDRIFKLETTQAEGTQYVIARSNGSKEPIPDDSVNIYISLGIIDPVAQQPLTQNQYRACRYNF